MFDCECGFNRNAYDSSVEDKINGAIHIHNWKGYLNQFFKSGYFTHKVALIDLLNYKNLVGGHKKNFQREAKRCEREGFFIKEINYHSYITEISEINRSKPIRCGREMKPDYLKSIDELGGQPKELMEPVNPSCRFHRGMFFGCFSKEAGFWGDGKLVAYIGLNIYGDFVNYSMILGHGNYLKKGIMQFFHLKLLEFLKANGFSRYIIYYLYDTPEQNLVDWKRRAGFRPHKITFTK